MKQYMRRVVLVLCMISCLFSLSACSSKAADNQVDPEMSNYVTQVTEGLVQEMVSLDQAQASQIEAQLLAQEQTGLASGVTSWVSVMNDTGALKEILSSDVTMDGEDYICTLSVVFEKRSGEIKAIYEMSGAQQSLNPISFSFVPVYSTGERMTKAGMNTLLGMGTVFCVLIFICLLITCFKFIAVFEKKMKDKADAKTAPASVPAPAPAAAVPVAENLTDDLELVAVITAAIAAAGNTSTDGLVVRSIKRVPSAKWKRA